MNKTDHSKELDAILSDIRSSRTDAGSLAPRLLLHCCCAPCSSYCLLYLLPYFDITCFFYNPNITDEDEYKKRLRELHRFVDTVNDHADEPSFFATDGGNFAFGDIPGGYRRIKVIDGDFEPDLFLDEVRNGDLASCPEGGKRCEMCFSLRLSKTYEAAVSGGFDCFTTTLTISPHKNAQLINMIGYDTARKGIINSTGKTEGDPVMWLPSDFKKKNGYKISIELSEKFGLYRQNYCGCEYSRRD